MFVPQVPPATPSVAVQLLLYSIPGLIVDHPLVFAFTELALELHAPGIGSIGQQVVKRALGETGTASHPALTCPPGLHTPITLVKFVQNWNERAKFEVEPKNLANLLGLGCVNDQRSALGDDIVTEHQVPADPFPLPPSCAHLVAGPF